MRSAVLTAASLGLTGLVLGNAWFQRQQFYPSVVYITKSNPSMAVIYLQSLVMVILMGKLMRKIFFGQLRAAEFEHLMERSWYAVTETCLAFTVFKDDFSPKFVALFTLLLFLKSFHWLAEDRVDYMERSPVITILFHLRVLSLALVLASLDLFFIQHAYTSTLTKGASVQLVFGFEYAILLTIVINTLVKYVLHSIDLHSENPWENKAVFMLYTELFIGFIKVLLYILFFVIMVRIYTLPLFAVRPMYLTMRAFKKAFNDVVLSRRAIHNMNTLYPDATAEELAETDNVCIICREEMVAPSAKKLPCGHIFHRNCLRSWFQRQQTCPTCRLDVLRAPGGGGLGQGHQQQQQQAGQAAFQQQMAALRNQLEAMQAQRPQPGVGGAQPQQNQQVPNFLNMMGQMGGVPPFAGLPGAVPPVGVGAPQQQQAGTPAPGAEATAGAGTSSASAGAAGAGVTGANGGSAGAAVRPPFMFPPFPFLPFTVPPPQPPPNFTGMSDTELEEMEGRERSNVEARIRCLRNIQVLLDAAVMEMQQYSAVVARANASSSTNSSASAAGVTEPTTTTTTVPAAADSTSTSETSNSSSVSVATSTVVTASSGGDQTSSVVSSAASASITSATVTQSSQGPFLSPSETGARPKVSSSATIKDESSSKVTTLSSEEVEDVKSEKPEENPFTALAEEEKSKTAEQEEIRKRRLAVFEEQKRRLMNK